MSNVNIQTTPRFILPNNPASGQAVNPPDVTTDPLYPRPSAVDYYGTLRGRLLSLDLSIARSNIQFQYAGTAIFFCDSTNATDRVSVSFDPSGDPIPMGGRVNKIIGVPFNQLYVTNAAIPGATATLIIFSPPPGSNFDMGT